MENGLSRHPAKLYRLPDGTWINPLTITSIIPKDADQIGAGEFFPPRVIVRYGDEFASTINCEHIREAMELCDRISFEVNSESARATLKSLTIAETSSS